MKNLQNQLHVKRKDEILTMLQKEYTVKENKMHKSKYIGNGESHIWVNPQWHKIADRVNNEYRSLLQLYGLLRDYTDYFIDS